MMDIRTLSHQELMVIHDLMDIRTLSHQELMVIHDLVDGAL